MYYQYVFFVGTVLLYHEDRSFYVYDIFHRVNHRMVAWSHQVRGQSRGVGIG